MGKLFNNKKKGHRQEEQKEEVEVVRDDEKETEEDKIELDLDITNLLVWLDTNQLFFSRDHKMRFIKCLLLLLIINGSQLIFIVLMFIEQVQDVADLNEAIQLLYDQDMASFAKLKYSLQDLAREIYETDTENKTKRYI